MVFIKLSVEFAVELLVIVVVFGSSMPDVSFVIYSSIENSAVLFETLSDSVIV